MLSETKEDLETSDDLAYGLIGGTGVVDCDIAAFHDRDENVTSDIEPDFDSVSAQVTEIRRGARGVFLACFLTVSDFFGVLLCLKISSALSSGLGSTMAYILRY